MHMPYPCTCHQELVEFQFVGCENGGGGVCHDSHCEPPSGNRLVCLEKSRQVRLESRKARRRRSSLGAERRAPRRGHLGGQVMRLIKPVG